MEENKETLETQIKTVRLDNCTVQDINKLAKEENRNFSNSVETLLKWALANRKVTVNNNNNGMLMT